MLIFISFYFKHEGDSQDMGYGKPMREDACLTLHIGAHKTATSTFQSLASNKKVQTGAYYPESGRWSADNSHNSLGMQFWDISSDEEHAILMGSLLSEIKNLRNVLISSEVLEKSPVRGNRNRLISFIGQLRNLGFRIRLLYTVRRQDCMIDAIFKHWVASSEYHYSGSAIRFADEQAADLDYRRIIEAWRPYVDEVSVVPFVEGDVWTTICSLFRMAKIDVNLSAVQIPHLNRSIEGDALRFKHAINQQIVPQHLNNRIIDALRKLNDRKLTRPTSIMTIPARQFYVERFTEGNHYITKFCESNGSLWSENNFNRKNKFYPANSKTKKAVITAIGQFDNDLAKEVAALRVQSRSVMGHYRT